MQVRKSRDIFRRRKKKKLYDLSLGGERCGRLCLLFSQMLRSVLAAQCAVQLILASAFISPSGPHFCRGSLQSRRHQNTRINKAYIPDGLSSDEWDQLKKKEAAARSAMDYAAWGPRFDRQNAPTTLNRAMWGTGSQSQMAKVMAVFVMWLFREELGW